MLHPLGLRFAHMPTDGSRDKRRQGKYRTWGRYLAGLRERAFGERSTPEEITELLDKMGVKTSGGSIRGYELGYNRQMDPVVLLALAKLYREPLANIVAVLAANREKPALCSEPELTDFEVEAILKKQRGDHAAEIRAANRFFEIGPSLTEIGAQLTAFGSEAIGIRNSIAATKHPRGQTSEIGDSMPPHDPDH